MGVPTTVACGRKAFVQTGWRSNGGADLSRQLGDPRRVAIITALAKHQRNADEPLSFVGPKQLAVDAAGVTDDGSQAWMSIAHDVDHLRVEVDEHLEITPL